MALTCRILARTDPKVDSHTNSTKKSAIGDQAAFDGGFNLTVGSSCYEFLCWRTTAGEPSQLLSTGPSYSVHTSYTSLAISSTMLKNIRVDTFKWLNFKQVLFCPPQLSTDPNSVLQTPYKA